MFVGQETGASSRVKHLKGALFGWALALLANIRLGSTGLSVTNTLAYLVIKKNIFITFTFASIL